jgi:hypothetical protein
MYEKLPPKKEMKRGPNRRYFQYMYVQLGIVPLKDLPTAQNTRANQWSLGILHKVKLTNYLGIIGNIGYVNERYYYVPKDYRNNYFRDFTGLYDISKARVGLNMIEGAGSIRFHLNKRGNHMGIYLDLGAYMYRVFAERIKMRGYALNSGGIQVKKKSLGLTEIDGYGWMMRFGNHNTALFFRWRRLNPWSQPLPEYIFGVEIGLF